VGMEHVAEDWSLTNTADIVLSFSATAAERQRGLGRMYVGKARDEEDKFGVLMTQSYRMGQFCLDSVMLDLKSYFAMFDDLVEEDEEADDDHGEKDNDDQEARSGGSGLSSGKRRRN
jgi:hypothetical protein